LLSSRLGEQLFDVSVLETTHVFVEGAESELGKRFPFGLQTYKEPKLTTRVF